MADSSEAQVDIHSLLQRQARRCGFDVGAPPTAREWNAFLRRVSATYESCDRDRYLLERSLEISSREMADLHRAIADDKALLDSVLAALTTGVCYVDAEQRCRFRNAAASRLLLFEAEATVAIADLFALETTGGEAIEWSDVYENLAAGHIMVEEEVVVLRSDGTRFPASVTFGPLMDHGRLVGLVISFVDISDQKRAQQAARQARIDAAAAEQARDAQAAFLANMSHELRTPLSAVLGYAELVIDDARDLGYLELVPDLETIQGAGRHLLLLINDVLDMAKMQAGPVRLNPRAVDIAGLIRGLAHTMRPLVRQNDNELILDISQDVGTVETDELRLIQSLLNVAGNANKFTRGGRVTIRATRREETVRIVIEDDGIGMERELVDRIFEPFVQADSSTTREYGGTGLGLAITRNLCRLLGVQIDVESEPGVGSTFTFLIPHRHDAGVEPQSAPNADTGR